jgi:hypothetical protein
LRAVVGSDIIEHMFDPSVTPRDPDAPTAPGEAVRALRDRLAALPLAGEPRGGIEQMDELERLKSAVCAAQARLAHDLDQHRRAQAEARRLLDPRPRHRRPDPDAGTGTEIALARREAPHEGRRKLRLARALMTDLPHTLAALERGDLNERRAEIIASETSDLTRDQRRGVDTTIASELDGLGDADLRDLVRREVLRRDEEGWLARHARARTRRRVSGRILGDGMGQLTAILPATDVSAIMTALEATADKARAAGDDRTRAQVVADTLVQRLGGPGATTPTAVALKVVLSAETLLGCSDDPGYVAGAGYVPASVARRLATAGAGHLRSSVQRLFAMPGTGALVATETTSSHFRNGLADIVDLRDRRCRTPYCNAAIRHHDHVTARAAGGGTTFANAQGLCEACNYAKESPGWRHETVPDALAVTEITVTTPTGQVHHSRAPDQPRPPHHVSPAERRVADLLLDRSG